MCASNVKKFYSRRTSGEAMSHIDSSKETYNTFLRCAHVNFRIIACLRAEEALDRFQVSQLSGEKSLIKRSEMIFEWMEKSQSLYDIFLRVMEENEQQHVSNLLKGIKDGPNISLSPPRYTRLEKIAPKLMDVIRNDEEFVAILRAKDAISEIDRQDITQEKKEYKRNWNLIEAILRRSEYAFDCFDQALRETLQVHVANYLHEGHMVAGHANTTHPDKDEVISDLLNKTILSESKDDTSSEEKFLAHINGYNIHPVAAKPGQSIVLFLYCKTVDDTITFTELFNSGDLQSIVEVILNRLLSTACPENTEQLKARLSLDNTEILAVEKFSGIEDWMPVELEKATIESKILQTVATQTELQFEETEKSSYEDVLIGSDSAFDFKYERSKFFYLPQRAKRKHTESRGLYYPDLKPSETFGKTKPPKTPNLVEYYETSDYGSYYSGTSHAETGRTLLTASAEERLLEDELRIKYKSERCLIAIIKPRADKEKKAIVGLTILDEELFALYRTSSRVDVYDSEKFSFCRRLNLEQLIDPMDIGSCNRNKCLYIFGYKYISESSEILRVDPNGKLINNWSTGNDWGCCLSVTDESNVILAVSNNKKLNEYSPDGQLIREISLSLGLSLEAGICSLMHAVQLTNGHFVVSHCDYAADIHRVCEVDAVGKLEKSFGEKCGSGNRQMNFPAYLAVGKERHVMIVDRWNGRVLLLDSDLKFMSEILTKEEHGLRDPTKILLDQANAKLFVADNGYKGLILVFDIASMPNF